jgi:hypothetical protein
LPVLGGGILRFSDPLAAKAAMNRIKERSEEVKVAGEICYRAKGKDEAFPGATACLQGDRTIVLAPESVLKKMLEARQGARSPLTDKLQECDLDHDAFSVVLMEPFKPLLKEATNTPDIPPELAGVKKLDEQLSAVKWIIDLDREKMLQITLEGKSDSAANDIEKLANNTLKLAKDYYPLAKRSMEKEIRPDIASKWFKVTDQIKDGILVTREGKNVTITLQKPKDL